MEALQANFYLFIYLLNDSWQVEKSSTSSSACEKEKKKSKKEKERALKPVWVSLFPAPRLLSNPNAVGWQRCNNTSSL
jgi:hypothetical protein